MKNAQDLISQVIASIDRARKMEVDNEIIWLEPSLVEAKNSFLFFVKPEITKPDPGIKLETILELILEAFDRFGFQIHEVHLMSAGYLDRRNLIDQHYGVISDVSHRGREVLDTAAREKFTELYGISPDEADVVGGIQFLERFPFFNVLSLDCLWQNQENFRLGGGTYIEKLKVDQETIWLLNGFHPKQLLHFTEPGRSIVLFHISGDVPWEVARTAFAGATNPVKAAEGSLRKVLLDRKEALGVPEIAQSFNGIHLSAGPLEALVELHRFDSGESSPDEPESWLRYRFGRELFDAFGRIPFEILANPRVEIDGKTKSVFDLTEHMDSDQALALLTKLFK